MQAKQVFSSYDYLGNDGLSKLKFCSVCGTECQMREDGGKMRPVCPKCGFIHYKNPYPAVSVMIVKDDKVLLGKRSKGSLREGKWCLPCGFIEFDEDFLTAARREVKEETGLLVEIKSIISVAFNYLVPSVHSLVIVMLANVSGGELEPGDDMSALEWVSLSGELPDMAFEADTHIINRYRETRLEGAPVDPRFAVYGD